ncbi:MAG: helix-turn-helix transcriptional regulator [Coleofasciculus sp. G3-WIS-01]|uniref:helix-turn-helix transcriptional regulator n=2 Tax=Coleofasciculus TaxID=669368 RepID=UPI0032F4B79B
MPEKNARLTLTKLRQRAGLTQQELASAIGVTQKTISIWEKGSVEPKLTFEQTKLLMEVLNCTLDELIAAIKHSTT